MSEVLAAASFAVGNFSIVKPPAYLVSDNLPRWGQWVMVVTPLGHCLGFLDPNGDWRDARDGGLLRDVQSWHLMDDEQAHAMKSAGEKDQSNLQCQT